MLYLSREHTHLIATDSKAVDQPGEIDLRPARVRVIDLAVVDAQDAHAASSCPGCSTGRSASERGQLSVPADDVLAADNGHRKIPARDIRRAGLHPERRHRPRRTD